MNTYSEGFFLYEIENNEITIVSYFGSEKEIIIPDHIGEMPVLKLGPKVFSNENIEVITIPETVDEVDDNCFINATNLKTIHSYSKADFKVPFGVELIYEEISYADESIIQENIDYSFSIHGNTNQNIDIVVSKQYSINVNDTNNELHSQETDYSIEYSDNIELINDNKQVVSKQEANNSSVIENSACLLLEKLPLLIISSIIIIAMFIMIKATKRTRNK